MKTPNRFLTSLAISATVLSQALIQSRGKQYNVGDDSFWSIPLTNDFYSNWSSSHFFQTGDVLYFDFDSGLHNVMEVSRREYESCTADHAFKAFWDGPAGVVLMEEGVFYFVCSIANYCALGQKLSVVVHSGENSPDSAPKSLQPSTPERSQISPPPATTPSLSQAPMMDNLSH